jgi:hypothetical protein
MHFRQDLKMWLTYLNFKSRFETHFFFFTGALASVVHLQRWSWATDSSGRVVVHGPRSPPSVMVHRPRSSPSAMVHRRQWRPPVLEWHRRSMGGSDKRILKSDGWSVWSGWSKHVKKETCSFRIHLYPVVVGFMTGFESRGAHGCEEQWNARDKRV